MKTNPTLKIVELRNYLIKPGARDRFVDYFENHFLDSQEDLDGYVLGQFRIKGEADKFFWIRGFTDLQSRLEFLRAFYETGEVWKRHGAGANEMMLDSDDVYLLKPLTNGSFEGDELMNQKGIVVIDFYFAKENQLDKLADFFQTNFVVALENKPTLWISEMSENDFPRLPVIQDKNLLVAITNFEDKLHYQLQLKHSADLKNRMAEFLAEENTLVLDPTQKSLTRGATND